MSTPLYRHVADQIAADIRAGVYIQGQKIPSVRKICAQFSVSHATAAQACGVLEDEGYVKAKPQSGYFVRSEAAEPDIRPPVSEMLPPATFNRLALLNQLLSITGQRDWTQLGAAIPDKEFLPTRSLQQHIAKVARFNISDSVDYQFSPGNRELRRSITIRMRDNNIQCHYDELIITQGCQEALALALQTVCTKGDLVAVESPCYYGLLQLLDSLGMQIIEIPTDVCTGVSIPALKMALEQWPVKACVLSSRYSNPTGACTSNDDKKQIVKLLREFDIPLIEDDVFGDLSHDPGSSTTFKSHDQDGRVLYCSSFSKTVGAGLRIGWCAPGKYYRQYRTLHQFTTFGGAGLPQQALASYLHQGGYDKHLRKISHAYAENLQIFQWAVQRYFPKGTTYSQPSGSFLLWVVLPEGADGLTLYRQACEFKISVMPGPIFSTTNQFNRCIRINCARQWSRELEEVMAKLGELVYDQLRHASDLQCSKTAVG
ncbi:MAG: PLP-dependent aminotransferase family protein [Pseudomonadales bacterium]|nr:PLP-dependent aminotransferase family protein [Pseudomonadales bacterium]